MIKSGPQSSATADDLRLAVDIATGAVIECNAALAQRMKLETGEIVGVPLLDLFDASCAGEAGTALDELRAGHTLANRHLTLKDRNGLRIPILLSAQPAPGPAGKPAARISCRDISRIKQVAHMEVLIEALPSGVLLTDQSGTITGMNSLAARIFGYRREELIGQRIEILVTEAQAGRHVALREKFHQSPEHRLMGAGREITGRRKDGSVFPGRDRPEPAAHA